MAWFAGMAILLAGPAWVEASPTCNTLEAAATIGNGCRVAWSLTGGALAAAVAAAGCLVLALRVLLRH